MEQLPAFLNLLSKNHVFAVRKDNRDASVKDVENKDAYVLAILHARGFVSPDQFIGGPIGGGAPRGGATHYSDHKQLAQELEMLWMLRVVSSHSDALLQIHSFKNYSDYLNIYDEFSYLRYYRFNRAFGL